MTGKMASSPLLGAAAATMLLGGLADAALAQAASGAAPAPPPATNSGVLRRIPLDQWMPQRCPKAEQEGEVVVCGRPEPPPTVKKTPSLPGDAKTDVPAERKALTEAGNTTPNSCTSVGPAGSSGCIRQEYEQWKRQRELDKAREEVPQPQ